MLRARKVAIVLDAGARRGAKSVIIQLSICRIRVIIGGFTPFPPLPSLGSHHVSKADKNFLFWSAHKNCKWLTVRKVFDQLGIEWKVIEERIIAVVSDGAGTMGAYVGLLNNVREKGGRELIGWVKDAAPCLMRAISTAKGKVKLWYDALDDVVSFVACFYRTSSKRMRGLWRKGGSACVRHCG